MKVDKLGRTPLHYVAIDHPKENHAAEIQKLVAEGCDPNLQDKNGWTALHVAAQESSLEAVKTLLASGAAVDVTDANGNTPLSTAVFNSKGEGSVILALLEAGADADKKNHHDVSPRSLAEMIANYDVKTFFQ